MPGQSDTLGTMGMVSTVVQDSPYKLFVGGLPSYLNEEQRWQGCCTSTLFEVLASLGA